MAARKLTVYKEFSAQLVEFEAQYGGLIVDCSTPQGMTSAKASRKEIRDTRSNLEDLRKATKAPVLLKCTQIDDEAKAIKEKLDALFTKFDTSIKTIENAKEIAKAKAIKDAEAKVNALEAREAAILAREIELGLVEPDDIPDFSESLDSGSVSADVVDDTVHLNNSPANKRKLEESIAELEGDRQVGQSDAPISTICEPHIEAAAKRLDSLRAIRGLVEPTDAQPEGSINEDTAVDHDAVLAAIWEIVDEYQ